MKDKFTLANAKEIIYVIGIISAFFFWFHTMNGLPPRVTKLEDDVEVLKVQNVKTDTKIDLILDDVKTVKTILLRGK